MSEFKPLPEDFKFNAPCPEWLKDAYRKAVNKKCQQCGWHEDWVGKLIPHRIKRGNQGGKYTLCRLSHPENNVKVVCKECHKILHGNEEGTNEK